MSSPPRLFSLLFLLLSILHFCSPAVIGIDYGAQWFKVAIVKPGKLLDVVLNKESKRRTQSIVTIRETERIFGSEAAKLATRFPQYSFPNLKSILGYTFNSSHCTLYSTFYDNGMVLDPVRQTPVFQLNENSTYTVEELVAMQLGNAKEQAEAVAGEKVKDAVITIPPFFNQFERQALLDAAELAGLRVLSLIHDETAVAINYAMGRNFPTSSPQYHIFYDMGAGTTVASLVSFQSVAVASPYSRSSSNSKSFIQLEVKSVGYDRTLGGHEFDMRIQQHLAEKFMELKKGKVKQDIKDSRRAMAKLLKEAERVKRILSANVDVMASVEGLHEEQDFRVKVTRDELEKLCADLFERVNKPIDDILKDAKLQLKDIDSLVLVGGGVRIPKVQEVLKKLVGEEKIAKNVNGDEAAVLGAGFRAAGISRQFRVRDIRVKDITPFTVSVSYDTEPKIVDGETKSRHLKTNIFTKGTSIDVEKYITFKRVTDFHFDVGYVDVAEEELSAFASPSIYRVNITDLSASLESIHEEKDANNLEMVGNPSVRVTMSLSRSGLVEIGNAELIVKLKKKEAEKTEGGGESLTDKLLNLVGYGNKENEEEGTVESKKEAGEGETGSEGEEINEQPEESSSTNSTVPESTASATATTNSTVNATETAPASADANSTDAKTEKKKEEIESRVVPLKMVVEFLGLAPMTDDQKKQAVERFANLDEEDRKRQAHSAARNNLESYIYSSKELLYDDLIESVTNETERETLSTKLEAMSEWLFDEGDSAETKEYIDRLDQLKELRTSIDFRVTEEKERPGALDSLNQVVKDTQKFIAKAKNNQDEDKEKLEDVIDKLQSSLDETVDWVSKKQKEQEKLQKWETPVLVSSDLKMKRVVLNMQTEMAVKTLDRLEKERERKRKAKIKQEKEKEKEKEKETKTKEDEKSKTESGKPSGTKSSEPKKTKSSSVKSTKPSETAKTTESKKPKETEKSREEL
ncbi:Hsp70 protein-domain-containing protein [Paraphysoderma sedebokerense]|nr:Hsp70 protein-domain-containing protein [Paraphysoderma sedebokerense]